MNLTDPSGMSPKSSFPQNCHTRVDIYLLPHGPIACMVSQELGRNLFLIVQNHLRHPLSNRDRELSPSRQSRAILDQLSLTLSPIHI